MLNRNIMDFFMRHNMYDSGTFRYIANNTEMFDYIIEEQKRDAMGFVTHIDDFQVLRGFTLCMPNPVDSRTRLIIINCISQAIYAYKYLNKLMTNAMRLEALGFLYEKLYILESNDPDLVKFGQFIDNSIDENTQEKYKFALFARDYLVDSYEDDINKMDKLSKKLVKIYNKQHK